MIGDLLPWENQTVGIGGGSSHGPALCAFRDRLFAAWKGAGTDQRMFWSSFDGGTWSAQQVGVGGGSAVGPSLSVFQDRLYAAWRGVEGDERLFWSSFDGVRWSEQQVGIGGGSSTGPGLATYGDRLYAVWKGAGDDGRMFWSSFDGQQWSPQQSGVGGGASGRPALAVFQGKLYAAWRGPGTDERLFWSSFDGLRWSEQQVGIGGGSRTGPSLAVYAMGTSAADDRLFAAWRGVGDDQRLFWSIFDGQVWSAQQPGIGGGTATAPSLASYRKRLYAGWKGVGADDRMFWSSIRIDRQPLQPQIIAPSVGATGVETRPDLRWADPGAGTVREAERFLVLLSTPEHPQYDAWIIRDTTGVRYYAVTKDLEPGKSYIWQIRGGNGEGTLDQLGGPPANGTFTTKPLPPADHNPVPIIQVELDTGGRINDQFQAMKISGAFFAPLETVDVLYSSDNKYVGSGMASGLGTFSISVEFPISIPTKVYRIYARGKDSGRRSADVNFSV